MFMEGTDMVELPSLQMFIANLKLRGVVARIMAYAAIPLRTAPPRLTLMNLI